jgi:acetoin utilization deacetylase AcuC-like enzyme
MPLALISHPDCSLHEMGAQHPEQPARLTSIHDALADDGLMSVLTVHEAPLVARDALEAVHAPAYVASVFAASPARELTWLDGDTAMNSHSLKAARRAAGAAVLGVDLAIADDGVARAFCTVRPPGHHAERDRAMGFCLFNNVAVAARHALNHHGLERVAIVDFDVHHGNGTEDIVAGDERILFCSTFQHPLYPYSGTGATAANVINVPLPSGTDGEGFRHAVRTHCLPRLEAFSPQLVFISAGFDAHQADPLAGLRLVDDDFAWVTRRLCEQANRSAGGRVVSTLEGGYDLPALASSARAHVRALLDT